MTRPTTRFKSADADRPGVAVTFDLFGTLVGVERQPDPGQAVAAELDDRGVSVPDDWSTAYRERHVDAPPGAAVPLPVHVGAALASRGVTPGEIEVRQAVLAAFDTEVTTAFDTEVTTRPGARRAIDAAAKRGPVGVLSNCSVPQLVQRTLARSTLDRTAFDAVVTSVDCGWRKPDPRAFEAAARRLSVDPSAGFVHVGDDPPTDGGVEAVDPNAVFVHVGDVELADLPEHLEVECH